jgi:hypothetical protein
LAGTGRLVSLPVGIVTLRVLSCSLAVQGGRVVFPSSFFSYHWPMMELGSRFVVA